jgi:hypothetical protein
MHVNVLALTRCSCALFGLQMAAAQPIAAGQYQQQQQQ